LILCQFQLQSVLVQKKSANAMGTALNVYAIIKKEKKIPTAPVDAVNSKTDLEGQKKRQRVKVYFWKSMGAVERINIPKLEDALRKQFPDAENRFVQSQVALMQTDNKIKVQDNVKVWIKHRPAWSRRHRRVFGKTNHSQETAKRN